MKSVIGIVIAVVIAIVALVFFTNTGDLISGYVSDSASKIETRNPLQTYELNSKQEVVCMLKNLDPQSNIRKLSKMQDSGNILERYPDVVNKIKEYSDSGELQRDYTVTSRGTMSDRMAEILLPVFMTELSINPSLENWFLNSMTSKVANSEITQLSMNCES